MRHLYYTLQTLLRGRGSNIIKVISLSLGLLMSVFLFARIVFELSFDNFYHEPENLYIVKTGWMNKGVLSGGEGYNTIQTIPAAIAEEFPDEVQSATTSCSLFGKEYRLGEHKFMLPTVMADTLYFVTLGIEVLEGNPQELANPDAIFLSHTSARTIFGSESPLGKTLNYSIGGTTVPMLVKGVYADVPLNTELYTRPEAIVSFPSIERHTRWSLGWNSGGNYDGYVRLRNPTDANKLNKHLSVAIARHIPEESGLELKVTVDPMRSLHLAKPTVRKMIWIMALLGVVLLFTTTLNYVLISIASLTQRAKSIGVHKCSGASERSIFSMFLMETAVVILLALLLIGVLVYVSMKNGRTGIYSVECSLCLAELVGTFVCSCSLISVGRMFAWYFVFAYTGDASVPSLYFRTSWLEAGTIIHTVWRCGIHTGHDAGGIYTI